MSGCLVLTAIGLAVMALMMVLAGMPLLQIAGTVAILFAAVFVIALIFVIWKGNGHG